MERPRSAVAKASRNRPIPPPPSPEQEVELPANATCHRECLYGLSSHVAACNLFRGLEFLVTDGTMFPPPGTAVLPDCNNPRRNCLHCDLPGFEDTVRADLEAMKEIEATHGRDGKIVFATDERIEDFVSEAADKLGSGQPITGVQLCMQHLLFACRRYCSCHFWWDTCKHRRAISRPSLGSGLFPVGGGWGGGHWE